MPALTRYRRPAAPEPTLRLISFVIRQAHFCLPLAAAHRVLYRPATEAVRSPSLVQVQADQIPVINIAPWVFSEAPLLPGAGSPGLADSAPDQTSLPDQTILIVESPCLGRLGLIVDHTPALRRVRQSAFSPVPVAYLLTHRLRGVKVLVSLGGDEPPLFLLDIDQILTA